MTRAHVAFLAAALAVVSIAACSDDEPSAADEVCDARTAVSDAVDTVRDDLADADFGQARDDAAAVGDAFEDLRTATGELAADERDALQAQVDALGDAFDLLTTAETEGDFQTAVITIQDQFEVVVAEITDRLDC